MAEPDPFASNNQRFLRIWRKSRKLTLESIAAQTGNAVSTVSGWETGRRTMDMEDLQKLATIYGVHPAALLMDPKVAEGKISHMQQAAGLAGQMTDSDAEQWIGIGKRLANAP